MRPCETGGVPGDRVGRGGRLRAEVRSVQSELDAGHTDVVRGGCRDGDRSGNGRSRGRRRDRDRRRRGVGWGSDEELGGDLDEEGIETAAGGVAGPHEILTGEVEVAFGLLDVVVGAATGGIEVGHHRGDHQDPERTVQGEADDLVGPHGIDPRGAAAAGVLLGGREVGAGVAVGEVIGCGCGPVHVVGDQEAGQGVLGEVPQQDGVGEGVPVVGTDDVAVAHVGVADGAVLVPDQAFGAVGQVEDAHLEVVLVVHVLQAHEPAAALVDGALVEVADLGEVLELPGVLVVDHAAEHLPGGVGPEGGGVHLVVVAGMHLPDGLVGAEGGGDVEHGLVLFAQDVVAQHARGVIDVDLGRLGHAPVPALGAVPGAGAVGIEQGTEVGGLAGGLVVAEQGGAGAAAGPVQTEEHEHLVAAGVIVDVAPVGVADRVDAVGAATVGGVGDADGGGVVGSREGEGAARRQQRLQQRQAQPGPQHARGGGLDEPARDDRRVGAGRLGVDVARAQQQDRDRRQPDKTRLVDGRQTVSEHG